MKNEKKNILSALFTLFMFVSSMFAGFAANIAIVPAVAAANGIGQVTYFEIDGFSLPVLDGVQTVQTTKDHVYRIYNNEPVGGSCIDEIIINYSTNAWTNAIDPNTITVTNMGTVIITNERDDGTQSGLVNDGRAIRIVPDFGTNGVMLCPGSTTQITIPAGNLYAPATPGDYRVSIYTSDQTHNEPSSSFVRAPISVLPRIHVTEATMIDLQYMDIRNTELVPDGSNYYFTATARGAWGRITELYLVGTAGTTVDVYMDNGNGVLNLGSDFKIATAKPVGTTVTTVELDTYGSANIVNTVTQGFVKDVEQGGPGSSTSDASNAQRYFIVVTGAPSALTLLGHADEDADQTIDPTYAGTGYFNPPKEGTVLNVEQARKRAIHGQLVRDDGGRLLYVKQSGIPIYYTTTLGTFVDSSPRLTDSDGQVEIRLNPGTVAGNAYVTVTFPDPFDAYEDVAIAPGAPHHKAITKGMGTSVVAGELQTIEVTVYDQYNNVISDTPTKPTVTFRVTSAPGPDADLDDDTAPPFNGDGDGFEQELTNLGIADVTLRTSTTIGPNVVEVCVTNPDLGCMDVVVQGVLGQAGQIDCQPLGIVAQEITADQCFDILVTVKDANGNPLPNWESIVEISLEQLDISPLGGKYIASTDLREEVFISPTKVKGKLNNNDPAHALITVCGCEALGTFDVFCKTDTLMSDREVFDVVNSAPTCIDVEVFDRYDSCDTSMHLGTSILDTCGNKVVDQECQSGGFASSCINLQASCGTLSTSTTCVDLGNTGMAPLVDLDISQCGCGDITITAIDTADCCDSVYPGALPQCRDIVLPLLGPAVEISMSVSPDQANQDNFWVSERTRLDLYLKDSCGQIVTCDEELVDVELTGEDCVDTSIQVNSPFTLEESEVCTFENIPVHKVVVQNCAPTDDKDWVDLPEKNDIVVDKFAFEYNGPTTNVQLCIYEETEESAGFQPYQDLLWKCVDLDDVPTVPSGDSDSGGNGAWDEVHDADGVRNGYGDVYLIELNDRISKYNGQNEYDNQRLGGALVEAGETKDFYFVISSDDGSCGTFDIDYLYLEDYNSPDIIEWGYGGHVIDTIAGSEEYTRRNDDYTGSDPYPNTTPATPDYGFGDRILHSLGFSYGHAFVIFRDLVAEMVNIKVVSGLPVVLDLSNGFPVVPADQAKITYLTQPATQVVAINHGDLAGDSYICMGETFEPNTIYDPDGNDPHGNWWSCSAEERWCRPAMACSDEGYDINLQVTDGFQNSVGLSTEVQLHECITYPHYIYLGDAFVPGDQDVTIDLWHEMGIDESSNPWDVCFDMAKFRTALNRVLKDQLGDDGTIASAFLSSTEFRDFVKGIYSDKHVDFEAVPGYPLSIDAAGHLVVTSDPLGRAKVRVTSDDSSMFQFKSFDASYRLFFVPHALDADYLDVAFAPGVPAKWDVIALPETGIPADGEQEGHVLIRKLDACGNAVSISQLDEAVKVTAHSPSGRAVISRDFTGNNNYDNQVVGYMNQMSCEFLFPWFEDCSLQVLNDVIENVQIVVEDAYCEQVGPGVCSGPQGAECEQFTTQQDCDAVAELCTWVPGQICQESDATQMTFVGAPVNLKITEIKHSDLIPADGWEYMPIAGGLPNNACNDEQIQECELGGEPEICFQDCVQYGNSGGWFTVEIQDKFANRVTTYLGDGFAHDPGDVYGNSDHIAEKICIAIDDSRAFIQDSTFGWLGLSLVEIGPQGRVYCGDLAFGRGLFKVAYNMLDWNGQPLDPRESRSVGVSVFDVCDRELFQHYCPSSWAEGRWDNLCNGQEFNENNLPDSETASRLRPDYGQLDFVALPDRWGLATDKLIVAADGNDYATLVVQAQNPYMDVRTSMVATVQSSLLGSKVKSKQIAQQCSPVEDGTYDPLNPTSLIVKTEDCSGGKAKLHLSSTEPGVARVTVTGKGFGCNQWINGYQYSEWFEETFGAGAGASFDVTAWQQQCLTNYEEICLDPIGPVYGCLGTAAETCAGLAASYSEYAWIYGQITAGGSQTALSQLYTPICVDWGVLPLTPAQVTVEFMHSYQNEIKLEQGWNFFSVPTELAPVNNQWNELGLNSICTASASWNDATQSWVSPVPPATVVKPLEAYWCHTNSAVNIPVIPLDTSGGVYLPPTKSVFVGWNDVGLSSYVERKMEHALISIDSLYSQVLDWVENMQRYTAYANSGELGGGDVPGTTGTAKMQAGQGYFIYTKNAGTLAGLQ